MLLFQLFYYFSNMYYYVILCVMYHGTLNAEKKMARGGITYHSVAKAAQQLLDKGENPTVDTIRAQLGDTGSRSTIGPFLKQWKARHAEQSEGAASGLPTGVLQAVKSLHESISAEAEARVELAQKEFQEKADALERQLQNIKQQLVEVASTRDGLADQLDQERVVSQALRTANAQLLEGKHDLDVRLAATVAELEASGHQLTAAKKQFTHFEQTMVEQRRLDRADTAQRLAERDQTIQAAHAEVQEVRGLWATADLKRAALAEQVSQLLQSLAESHASQQKTEAAWAAETLVWQQERAQFTEQAHRAAIDLGTVNQQLKDTAARHDNLMASHNILQSDYQRVLQEKARLEGRLAQQGEALTPPMDTQPAGDKA